MSTIQGETEKHNEPDTELERGGQADQRKDQGFLSVGAGQAEAFGTSQGSEEDKAAGPLQAQITHDA